MPLLEGNVVPPGLKKPESMSGVDGKQKLMYGGNYLAFDPKGTDVGEFTPPWSSLKASLLEGRSPVCHFSGMERQNALVYRQEDHSSNEGHSNSSRMCHTPVKQGFSLYTKSSGLSSPRAPTTLTVKRHKTGGENSTPGFENSVYLNIPKPVYGQNPCCHELGCGLGPRYEHGLQRIPNSLYEHDWLQNESRYSERAYIHRKEAVLQFEPSTEQIKKMNTDTCSPSKVRKLPDPSYSSYPYIPTHTFLSPLSESGQQLHTSLRGCQSRFPSHATYEGMTSEMYQESSPLPKYGQLTHHPLVYYPSAHVEIENRHLYKDIDSRRRDDVPVVLRNTLLNSRNQSRAPHSLHGEIPMHLPGSEGLPHHPFNQRINYPYPYYAVPRYHLPQSPLRTTLARPHLSPPSYSNYLSVSPSGTQATVALSSAVNKHKPNPAPYASPSHASLSFPHVDQNGVPHYPPAISPTQLQRFVTPFPSLHLDKAAFAGASLSSDYSSCESRIPSPKTPQDLSSLSPSWLFPSPTSTSEHKQTPPNNVGDTPTSNATLLKRLLKRSFSNMSSTVSDKDEDQTEGMDLSKKRIKVEIEDDHKGGGAPSPPMPVIDSVFSLAPYRSLMGLHSAQSPQHGEVKPKLCIKKESTDSPLPDQDPPNEETSEPTAIQVKKEPPDSDQSKEESVNTSVKKEVEESEMQRVVVVDKCDPELKSHLSDEDKRPSESKPAVAGVSPPPLSEKSSQQEVVVSPLTITAPKLPGSKPNIENVPPKPPCYQAFTDLQHSTFVSFPGVMRQQVVELSEIPKPVRKNFLELHRSVCKLVSTFVSTCSVRKLRDWLSQLQITESPSSLTKVKISKLLSCKAWKEWLDPEITAALEKVLERLREYSSQDRFPFPHVMRAGSVFLPMLVVKEIFFPMVQGSFIDQVLQEHKVELRPSTLSEEKLLIQSDKRASSSKLRRLMSLKHLPEVYADIFNLVYYTHVCKHIGLANDTLVQAEEVSASPATQTKDTKASSRRTKSRIKRISRLLFLDDSWSDGGDAEAAERDLNIYRKKSISKDSGDSLGAEVGDSKNSWTCPLSLDDVSSSTSDAELDSHPVSRLSTPAKFHHVPKKGMVLKLRRMFSGGPDKKTTHYQAVSDSNTEVRPGKDLSSVTPARRHRGHRTGDFHKTLRHIKSSSKRRLLKIKYCPFLSACHSADRRRRWVLRSAVKTAHRAMRLYPDLVGKRIRHLYEEDDKTEVWYRGEVVRVHEAHTNPLKTIYEVRYDSEPEWTYYLELLMDFRKGWIQIEE